MADRSAVALAGLLLGGEAWRPAEALAARLADDPPLVLWTICVAAREDGFQPRCLDEVAAWLAEHAHEVLDWQADGGAQPPTAWASQAQPCADRVATAVRVACLAAELAGEEPPAAASVFLLGLLHDAEGWLALGGKARAEDCRECLPQWLREADREAAGALVKEAVGMLAGEAALPDSVRIDLENCRRRGDQAAQRWLTPVEGVGDWLPLLAARLARLAGLEERFNERLETEKLEAMAEFAAGAGHEINNPLTVITGRAQLLLREETDPERRRALALISTQARRAHEMIADMMLFARPSKPEPTLIDLVELADRVVEEVSPQAARQEITVRRTSGPDKVEIEADGAQLPVALRAMCQNALEAIGHHGRVEIDVYQGPGEVQIRVADDGPGIPPEDRRHLFDPYFSARQAGRGLGLGLSKCWRIVTNHGGRIDVDGRPEEGTVFTITLPPRPP